jgi:hypothetical protein
MEISSVSGTMSVQTGRAAADGMVNSVRGNAGMSPEPSQMPALPAAHPVAVQVALQQVADRAADPRDGPARAENRSGAQRGYGTAAHLLDSAKSFAERITLIPKPGDLSLEASRLPPNGIPRDDGSASRHIPADKLDRQA